MTYQKIKEELKELIYFLNGAIATERDPVTNDLLFLLRARIQEIIGLNLETKVELHDDIKEVIKYRDGSSSIKLPKEEPFIFHDSEAIDVPVKKKRKADVIIKREDDPTLEDIINDIPADRTKSRLKILQSLNNVGITNLIELIQESSSHIGSVKGIGPKRLAQLIESLKNNGYKLND